MAINKIFGGQQITSTIQDFSQVRKIPTVSGNIKSNTQKIPFYDQVAQKGVLGITIDDLLQTGRCFPELERFFNSLKNQLNQKISIINKMLSLLWQIIDMFNQLMDAIDKYGLFQILWNSLMLLLNQMLGWLTQMGLRYILNQLYSYIRDLNKFLNSSALMRRIRCMTDAILTNKNKSTIGSIISQNRNTMTGILTSAQKQFTSLIQDISGYNKDIPTIQSIIKPLGSQANNQLLKGKVPSLGNLSKDPFQIMKQKVGSNVFKF